MDFNLPTTKDQMYNILSEIFYHYRIKRDPYEEFVLPELDIDKIEFISLTEEELLEKATTLLASKQQRELLNYKKDIEEQIVNIQKLLALEEMTRKEQVEMCNDLYAKTMQTFKDEAQKNGLTGSSVIVKKISDIELEKSNKLIAINYESAQKKAEYQAKIESLNAKYYNAETYFSTIFNLEITEKVIELKKEQEKVEREIFKYNNSIEEKCQRYKGTVASLNANLKLKYLQINSDAFSKEELLEMGYYKDVVNCICGYYDTLSNEVAYLDIVNEKQLIIYLDDYYQNIIYLYQAKANLGNA